MGTRSSSVVLDRALPCFNISSPDEESRLARRRVGSCGELTEARRTDEERLSCEMRPLNESEEGLRMANESEGLRMCMREGAHTGELCGITGDVYCAGETKRDARRCKAAIVRRGETGSEFGAELCAGADRGGCRGAPGRANAQRGHGRSEGHRCEVRGLPCASSKKGGHCEKGWKRVDEGEEEEGGSGCCIICAIGEMEFRTRRFAIWRSVGERGGEIPGDPEGEQKGESNKREGGEGAGGIGDPGVVEDGGEWGMTGERGVLECKGEAGERSKNSCTGGVGEEVFMWEKLMGERREWGRICRALGEDEVGVWGGEGGGDPEVLEAGEMEAEPEVLEGGVGFAKGHSSPVEVFSSS